MFLEHKFRYGSTMPKLLASEESLMDAAYIDVIYGFHILSINILMNISSEDQYITHGYMKWS